jgi:hypothetical protein
MVIRTQQFFCAHYKLLIVVIYIMSVTLAAAYVNLYMIDSLLNSYVITQPYLIAHGFIPYLQIEDPRTPLVPQLLAWLQPFFGGNAPRTARIVHLVAVVIIIMLVLIWLYRGKGWWATLAGGTYILAWMIQFGYWAISYYEIILAPIYFVIFLLLIRKKRKYSAGNIFLIGFLLAVGVLIKQQTGILALLVTAWLLVPGSIPKDPLPSRWRRVLYYIFGLSVPLAGYGLYYWHIGGDFGEWYYWNVSFIFSGLYSSQGALQPSLATIISFLPSLIMVVPFCAKLVYGADDDNFSRSSRLWLLLLFIAACIYFYPRYSGRHWAAAFPFLSAIAGIVCADIVEAVRKSPAKFFHYGLALTFILWWFLQFALTSGQQIIQPQPLMISEYTNILPLANELRSRFPADGGLVILPVDEGNANLYYQLGQLPPRYYMDFYPYFVNDRTSQKWLDAVDTEKPQTLIYFKDRFDLAKYSPQILEYVVTHYEVVDTVSWEESEVQIMTRRDGE